ncbi:integrase [Sphingomonas turrisvirgatae]|uniref:Integrase n=2 Tax=Sphingomonadaceae TaxID=41297 RepID=A0A1E3LV55_9SPHN|nr:integrase [Sphingomonas turrisvirgatae]
MGLADARTAARAARLDVEKGTDPNEEKRKQRRAAASEAMSRMTLTSVLDDYQTSVLDQNRTGAATRRALDGPKGLLKPFASRKPVSIMKDEILPLVKKLAIKSPISANRKLAYASAFFNWCVDAGYVPANPVATIRKPSRERERERFHTLEELREIWAAAGTLGYPFEQLYKLLIVLPNRRQEIASMSLDDLTLGDLSSEVEGVWLLPRDKTKMANALRIPVSLLARGLIIEALNAGERPAKSRYVFTTTGDTPISGYNKAKRRLDAAIAAARIKQSPGDSESSMPHWVVHDFRTTFNTHACEILQVPPHVADRILNHVATATRSKVMRVYNKSELFEQRREALNAWADLVTREVIRAATNVESSEVGRCLQIPA